MRTEQVVVCHVCRGLGVLPIENISAEGEFPPRFAPSSKVAHHFACQLCKGSGELLVTVDDTPERRSYQDYLDGLAEEHLFRSSQEMHR